MGAIFNSLLSKLNLSDKNENIYINNMKEDDIHNLCLKIYIVGSGDKKKYIIDNIFKDSVSDENLKDKFKVNKQFKTEQFHWIAHAYDDGIVDDDLCKSIGNEILNDKKNDANNSIILKNEVIICFGNENTVKLGEYFTKLRKSNMIFITEKQCELHPKMDKRYAINIIYNDKDNKEIIDNQYLNVQIISILWELDCYFKEKGNIDCRYTPENIFKGLERDNSLFSLNILLTGLSRVGKSTFINLLSRKLNALESNLAVSVTKNVSEYYVYKDDDKNDHAAIKLIDTPGIVKNNSEHDYVKKEKKIIELITKQEQSFEKRIHFIFFLLMEGRMSTDGDNVKKIFKALNESKCPVFFIINKVKKTANFKEIIRPLKEFFNKNGFKNISKDENFIAANFLEGTAGEIYGIDTIFSKVKEYINEKKIFDNNLKSEMENLLKDFRSTVESDKSFLGLKKDDILNIKELKEKIYFEQRMNKIKIMIKNNELFSNINIQSIMNNGRNSAYKTKDTIISLSNLKDIIPSHINDLSTISIYQAFMVKEIGERYGLDINILNSGTKLIFKYIGKSLPLLEGKYFKKDNIKNTNDTNKINKENVEEFKDIIKKKSTEKLENVTNNNKTVYSIADIIDRLKEMDLKKGENNNDNDENSQNKLTFGLFNYCIFFFEKEIKESEGLSIMMNYLNKFLSILNDIDYYIQKKDWKNFEMEIKII